MKTPPYVIANVMAMEDLAKRLGQPSDADLIRAVGGAVASLADIVWKAIEWKRVHPGPASVFHATMAEQIAKGRTPRGRRLPFWRWRVAHHKSLARRWAARAAACGNDGERCR